MSTGSGDWSHCDNHLIPEKRPSPPTPLNELPQLSGSTKTSCNTAIMRRLDEIAPLTLN